jgi:hypothetical protein
MIVCSKCNSSEILGSLFCSECGAQLDTSAGSPTDSFDSPIEGDNEVLEIPAPVAVTHSRVTLYFSDYDVAIQFDEEKEYSIGRISEGQLVLPDIDLSQMEGFENGISRVHASLRVEDKSITVQDLGSSNGSMLNEKKLIPHLPYEINDMDVLIFGKLIASVMCKK